MRSTSSLHRSRWRARRRGTGLLLAAASAVVAGFVGCIAAPVTGDGATPAAAPAAARVLIVTGEDYKGHHWRQTTPVLQRQLAADRRFAVEVVQDLARLRDIDLRGFAAVVLHFKNYDPQLPGRVAFERLAEFVRGGGGLVLVHFACGAFQEYGAEFEALAGRVWNPKLRGHDPHGRFPVEIVAADHAVTTGLSGFETTDELYTCLDGSTPITVLAEARSRVDGKRYPMAFVLRYGAGRVFHSPLGHDVRALTAPAVGDLFRRGCAWVAGLDPVAGAPVTAILHPRPEEGTK